MESKSKVLGKSKKGKKVGYRRKVRIGSSVYVLKDKGLNVCGVVGCKRGSSMVFIDKDNKGEKVVISLCSVHSVFDEIF